MFVLIVILLHLINMHGEKQPKSYFQPLPCLIYFLFFTNNQYYYKFISTELLLKEIIK